MKNSNNNPKNLILQLLLNFVIPIFILTRLSGPQMLGPIKGLLLALAFPIAYELFSIYSRKKVNITSVIVIVGIMITGALGLLQVSSFWLALRRAVPYLFIAAVLIGSQLIKKPIIQKLFDQMLDNKKIDTAAKKQGTIHKIQLLYSRVAYLAAALFLAISLTNFIVTKRVVVSPPKSTAFNQELARLRLLSILSVTVPLLAGSVLLTFYIFLRLEKLTGLTTEELTK